MSASIDYTIHAIDPYAHLFEVTCTVTSPDPQGQVFYMPAWVPGSYKIRDFSKQVSNVRADSKGKRIECFKLDKQTWQCAPLHIDAIDSVTIRYWVYAWDLSVRGSHLDQTHATINGASVFMSAVGKEEDSCIVEVKRPQGSAYKKWRVATALSSKNTAAHEFGEYHASNYAELIDSPIELGDFEVTTFTEQNISHELVFSGAAPNTDFDRITKDVHRICKYYLSFFPKPHPMKRYVFLITLLDQGFGGLEHRASTCLHFSKYGLPTPADNAVSDVYLTFLTLCSHEYLHTWLIKGIKPSAFMPYDLYRENYTEQLWIFEGFTAYYEDLILVRNGLITEQQFFNLLAQKITRLWRTPGRANQTVTESSYDAWIKFYQPDEHTPNITVSYYLKGSLIALILDIALREKTNNKESLDTVLLTLWDRYSMSPEGVPEHAVIDIIREYAGTELDGLLSELIYSTQELPLKIILKKIGITLLQRPARQIMDKGEVAFGPVEITDPHVPVDLGVIWDPKHPSVVIQNCLAGSAAQRAGLSAGDMVISIDQLRVEPQTLSQHLARYTSGDKVLIHAFRRDLLMEFNLTLETALPVPVLIVDEDNNSSEAQRRNKWLK